MVVVPAISDSVRPASSTGSVLALLPTTGLRRVGVELPPVCLHLTSSTPIGLRIYLRHLSGNVRRDSLGHYGSYVSEMRPGVCLLAQAAVRPTGRRTHSMLTN